ncbi:MAG: MBL fold metallo-hydrolase [Deltaproteobacteria bacterium]|nr:MBL fold metallo-hydrolase [Deltaproteobacteria bacterium]
MRWKIGNVTVTRVIEVDLPTPGGFVLPDALPENLAKIPWLAPHFVTADGMLRMSIHALIVESQGRKILVDTCLGNDKKRPIPDWNMRSGPFLQQLADAGHPRESVDTVVCTHLHVDHVGWNTMLVGGRWVPTFENARYLIGRKEWDYWGKEPVNPDEPIMDDSVRPIIDAGLADLVETDHKLTSEVWLEPTHGHTPGHVSVRISSVGEDAVITGDMMHHPSQIAKPEWASSFDWNQDTGRATRRSALERWSAGGYLVIGTHFATPTAGRIVRDGDAWRFAV